MTRQERISETGSRMTGSFKQVTVPTRGQTGHLTNAGMKLRKRTRKDTVVTRDILQRLIERIREI